MRTQQQEQWAKKNSKSKEERSGNDEEIERNQHSANK